MFNKAAAACPINCFYSADESFALDTLPMLSDSQRRRRTFFSTPDSTNACTSRRMVFLRRQNASQAHQERQIPGQIHTLLFAEYVLFYHATISNQYEYADSIITIIPRKRCH